MNKARMEQLDIALTVWREWIDYYRDKAIEKAKARAVFD